MPELRQNFFTREWVIIATERAKRPKELARKQALKEPAEFVANCPFCLGNEDKTPPEVLRVPAHDGAWQVRIVANKFAALSRDAQPVRTIHRSRRAVGGFGVHDVIIETPNHAHTTALLDDAHVANVLRAYKSRYDELSQDPRIAHITIFKNHGLDAGTSLEHPHSQLIATPVISSQVRGRFQVALQHYDEFGECMFCQMINEELMEESASCWRQNTSSHWNRLPRQLRLRPTSCLAATWPTSVISVPLRSRTSREFYGRCWASSTTGSVILTLTTPFAAHRQNRTASAISIGT